MQTSSSPRRHDLDWLRIAAFGLLIFYHIGMFYVSWGWHVKSPRASEAIEPLMLLLNPWRLGLLFLVAGAATAFMAARLSPAALARDRFNRLFWPLLAGMFLVVPPQTYFEIVEKLGWAGGFPRFYALYVSGYDGWCPGGECIIVPTWNHLWFVVYILAYALIAAALLALRLPTPKAPGPRMAAALFLVGPWLWLWAMRALLFPVFDSTHALVDDWYNHSIYLPLFLLGFAVARAPFLSDLAARLRWVTFALFLIGYAGGRLMATGELEGSALLLARGLRELQAWAAILTALGFARRHLADADGPARRLLTRAIFPCYVVHQTAIVAAAFWLSRQGLPLWVEAGLILVATILACALATYAAFRWRLAGFLLGVAPASPARPAVPQPLPASAPAGP